MNKCKAVLRDATARRRAAQGCERVSWRLRPRAATAEEGEHEAGDTAPIVPDEEFPSCVQAREREQEAVPHTGRDNTKAGKDPVAHSGTCRERIEQVILDADGVARARLKRVRAARGEAEEPVGKPNGPR